MKKYTTKDIIKNLQKATAKNDIKLCLTGVHSNTETQSYIATDSYRLHCYGALNVKNMLPTGIYNLETMQIIEESYPDTKQLLTSKDPLSDIITNYDNIADFMYSIQKVKSTMMKYASGKLKGEYIDLYDYKGIQYEPSYIDDAIEFLKSIMETHHINNQLTVRLTPQRMLHISIKYQPECYAIVMGKAE